MGTKKVRVLVVRHETCTNLGMLNGVPERYAVPIDYLNVLQGEVLSEPVTNYSHMILLGGRISAYEDDQYPCLRYEFKLLEEAIAQETMIVGICLGAQILAQVLGTRVYRGESGREAGWCEIQLTDAAKADLLLQDFPKQFRVFQSHQDTFELPSGSVHLAKSNKYPNQAFRYGNNLWAFQFHPEFDEHVLNRCAAVIEQELRESQITDVTLDQLLDEAKAHSPAVAPLAESLMQHFLVSVQEAR